MRTYNFNRKKGRKEEMPPVNRTQKMNIVELQRMNILALQELAKKLEVVDSTSLRKQELIFSILKH